MDIRRLVGKNVRRCRLASGLSQEELGARIRADQGYVSRIEAGQVNLTLDTITLIGRALSVAPAALFEQGVAGSRGRS